MENEEKKPEENKPEEKKPEDGGALSALTAEIKRLKEENEKLSAGKADAEKALRDIIDGRNQSKASGDLTALKNMIKW